MRMAEHRLQIANDRLQMGASRNTLNGRSRKPSARVWPLACLVVLGLLTGCRSVDHGHRPERCCDFAPEAIPAPQGTYVRGFQHAQTSRAAESAFTIYNHQWYQGGGELGPGGALHLEKLIARLPIEPHPIVLEPQPIIIPAGATLTETRDEARAIDEIRRQAVVASLAEAGIPDADARVIVAYPQAEGLDGNQAPMLYWQLQRGGARGGGMMGGGAGGGMMGGGMGGGMMGGGMGGRGGGGGMGVGGGMF
jgi:hypothetical protein